jgi:hypothetical protein
MVRKIFSGLANVFLLSGFVTTAQQQYYGVSFQRELNPVSWSEIHAQLRESVAQGPGVAEIAEAQTLRGNLYSCRATTIRQGPQPLRKRTLPILAIVAYRLHYMKQPILVKAAFIPIAIRN